MNSIALRIVIVFLTSSILVVPAAAQNQLPPTGYDQIGIYTEPDFDGSNAVFTEGTDGEEITAYIVLTGLTAGSVGGFECKIDLAGDSEVLSTTFPVEAIDVQPQPDKIVVGFSTPVPADDGIAMVCTLGFLLLSDPEWLYLGPLTPGGEPPNHRAARGERCVADGLRGPKAQRNGRFLCHPSGAQR